MNRLLQTLLLLIAAPVVWAQPVANFTASSRTGCAPMVVSFTSTSTGSPTSYSWNFGNGNTSNLANPVAPYTVAGTYTVTLTVSNASGSNTRTQTGYITVYQVPAVSLSATPVVVCPGAPVSFASSVVWNSAGTGSYTWDFGDGGTSSLASPVHTYTRGGVFTVKLTGTNSVGCPRTDTQANLIFVHPKPGTAFSASDTAVCSATATTTLTASPATGSSPFSFMWDFGDGSGPGTTNPVSHAYANPGMYTVKLHVTDANGCRDSLVKANFIRRRSIATGFTATSAACIGASVNVANTTGSTSGTMTWNFGDGSALKTGTSTSHNYTVAGTHTITQSVIEGGCVQTATQSVTIHGQPNSAFTFIPAAPCPAPAMVQFNAAATAASNTYSWNFGDGLNGVGAAPGHWYSTDWMYRVTLGVTDANGCSSTTTQMVNVDPIVQLLEADKVEGCIPLSVKFKLSVTSHDTLGNPKPYPNQPTSYSWNFGDGSTGTGASPTHIYTTVGRFMAVVTCVTANGCTVTDSMEIQAGVKPTADFTATPRTVCVNAPVNFTDYSTSTSVPVNMWFWDFGAGGGSNVQHPVPRFNAPGTYDVRLAAGIYGCFDTMTKLSYIVVNDPKARMQVRTSCTSPLQVTFADSSIGATSHIWRFGDGTSSTAAHPVHTYPAPGNYVAWLVVANSVTGCVDSVSWPLNLNPLSVSFTANKTQFCKGDTLRLAATTSGGGVPVFYEWWVGNGATPAYGWADDIPTHARILTSSGLFNVAMRITDHNGCHWTSQRNNYILVGGPVVRFTAAPPIACIPFGNVTFTDISTHPPGLSSVSRTWDFGDGSPTVTAVTAATSHNYTTSGNYGIILKVTDNIGCTDSATVPNYLRVSNPAAVWSTTGSRACENAPFNFFNSSSGNGLSYQWSFGDGRTSTQANPTHVYTSTGSYTVRLIVTDNIGCKDTLTRAGHVTVNSKPAAAFDLSDSVKICPPLIINFTDRSVGAVRWNWTFGTGGNSTLQNPSHTYSASGIYSVRLVATNVNNCSDTVYKRARLLGYGGVMTYGPLTGCAPLTVTFVANDVDFVPGFIYHYGDGNIGATTGRSITYTYNRPGRYIPSLTMTDNLGCIANSLGLDTIRVDGVISGFTFAPFPACDRGTIQFIDTSRGAFGPIDAPFWTFGDGTSSSAQSPSKTYPGPGKYPVTLYHTTATGCRDTLRSAVVFHPLPKITAGPDTSICASDTATLRPRGGISYVWAPGGSLSCTDCTNPGAVPQADTRYIVTGTDTNGCTNTDTVLIRVKTKVDAIVGPDAEICSGKMTGLSVTGGAIYEWYPKPTLHNSTTANPTAFPTSDQRYMVISRLASCVPDTDYVNVVVHETPKVDAGRSRTIIAGESRQLEGVGTGPIVTWEWTPAQWLSCSDCYNPEAQPKRSTVYTVEVKSGFGCTATDTVRVTVLCDQGQVFIPNTFTPEGNGVNDIFYPRGRGLEIINRFRIYNRWGELVFERTNMTIDDRSQGWDGRKEGRLLSPDVYVYTVEATCDTGEPIKWQGDVMLLR